MQLVSVNVGLPKTIVRNTQLITTGIFKSPVKGPVVVRTLNLDGDQQADLKVHGGVYKAVYSYPVEHYPFWGSIYPEMELPWGSLGENLTTSGMLESSVAIGDQFRIGSAVLQVTQPRVPCFKLAAKFDDDEIIPTFRASGRPGFYFSVIQEGQLQAGDTVELILAHSAKFTISEALRLYSPEVIDDRILERALNCDALPPGLRRRLEERSDR
jgi:MOSC domain-containing protein YiiM